jgi:hypothetical protein
LPYLRARSATHAKRGGGGDAQSLVLAVVWLRMRRAWGRKPAEPEGEEEQKGDEDKESDAFPCGGRGRIEAGVAQGHSVEALVGLLDEREVVCRDIIGGQRLVLCRGHVEARGEGVVP